MARNSIPIFVVLVAVVMATVWLTGTARSGVDSPAESLGDTDRAGTFNDEPIRPLPLDIELDIRKVALGKRLFHDPRLSRGERISCAGCHDLKNGGDDGQPHFTTYTGSDGSVNTLTVWNAVLNYPLMWRGAFETLEQQADAVVHDSTHFDTSWPEILTKLADDEGYAASFRALYDNGMTEKTLLDAITTYEHSLLTPNSPFDRFLRGEVDAISKEATLGYEKFKSYGCIACHQGMNVGGNLLQKLGIFGDYFADRGGEITDADLGRFTVTRDLVDRHVFRVPSLRNVALTAPYFHDGSQSTLADAVATMARYQLGRPIASSDVAQIVAFLQSLTGDLDALQIIPVNGNKTR